MGIVPATGIVRKLYEDAAQDIEHKPSAFWQVWLQRSFFETDVYSVTVDESSPDSPLRGVDIVVKRYNHAHDTIPAMLWVECEGPSGSIAEAERQALDAASRCMVANNLLWIYAMTTVGVSFRSWVVSRGRGELEPLHGAAVAGDRTQYIDADSEAAWVFERTVSSVKSNPPLRYAPVLPSQSLSNAADDSAGGLEDQAQGSPAAHNGDQTEESTATSSGGQTEELIVTS